MGNRLALCIGINKYANAKHINLQYAKADCEELEKILRDSLRGNFNEVNSLIDEQATKKSIRDSFDKLLQSPQRRPDDLILFFFSGHGVRDRQGDLCLVPSDFNYHSDGSLDFSSLIHTKELETSIGNSNSQNIILLIDSCHSGALGKAIGRTIVSDDTNLFVLGASRASESAMELGTIKHGAFTECLLRSLNLPPDKGEWITLGRIMTFVSDEIRRFQTSQLIQSTNRFVDLNINIARNPSYSLKSEEFTQEVARIFELANYDIQTPPNQCDYPNFFIARVQTGFRPSQIGVLCLDDREKEVNISESHIQQFLSLTQQLHSNHEIGDGMLITHKKVSAQKKQQIEGLGITSWLSNDDLLRQLIDFNRYLRRLIDEFDKDGIDKSGEPAPIKYYVDLEAKSNIEEKQSRAAFAYIEEWIDEKDRSQLAILGEYGSGKTTLSKKLARDLAEKCLRAKTKKDYRIPILIPLREFPKGQADIEAFITGFLARRCNVSNPSFEAFKAMNDAGFLLLILDGFDEMAIHVDSDVMQSNLAQLEQLAASSYSKVLLTSRPEYFITEIEERQALKPEGLYARRTKFKSLHLCGFSEEQIQSFLQKRIPTISNTNKEWTFYLDQIKKIHDLSDLSSRPVLLEMIVKTLPELIQSGEVINRPNLYQTYLEGELQRQSIEKRRTLLIKIPERFKMMQTLALYFYIDNPIGISADLVQILIYEQLSPDQTEELEAHTRDFLTCSFLKRDGNTFTFSHQSFIEFFSARAFYDEITKNNPENFKKRKLTKEVINFLIEMKPNRDTLHQWIQDTGMCQ